MRSTPKARDRLGTSSILGLAAGTLFGCIQYTLFHVMEQAAIGGALISASSIVAIALVLPPSWRSIDSSLSRHDRFEINRAVWRNGPVSDLRTANFVLEGSADFRLQLALEGQLTWIPLPFIALTFPVACVATVFGSIGSIGIWWSACLTWAALFYWLPRRLSRLRQSLTVAEDRSRQMAED